MLTELRQSRPQKKTLSAICAFVVLVASVAAPARRENPSGTQKGRNLGHQIVILLDVNPNQKTVLHVELNLTEGVIHKLNQPENVFSIVTFGCQQPTLVKADVGADDALSALQNIEVEQNATDNISTHLREGVNFAFDHFTDARVFKSVLIISEGKDYFPGKIFKQTVLRAQQLQVEFHVALVANHTFYGTKGIQHYGFDLRRLAAKTHGRYIEVGSRQSRVPAAVNRLAGSILGRVPTH